MATGQWESAVREGDEVVGADGDKVGNVTAVTADYLVVEKGWFFPSDYYIPLSAVTTYDDGRVHLNVTKEVALNQGWESAPVAADAAAITERDAGFTAPTATGTGDLVDAERVSDETLEVPVYEEELKATTHTREVGGVRIKKEVVAEEQTLDVPVTEERLRVVRRTVDRPAEAANAGAFEEVIVDVPLEVEEVDVEKRVRVAEEIAIQTEKVQRIERVAGTVRREEVTVTETEPGAVVNDLDLSR